MLQCWHADPDQRPTFSQLQAEISTTLTITAGYMDFSVEVESKTITPATKEWENQPANPVLIMIHTHLIIICTCMCNQVKLTVFNVYNIACFVAILWTIKLYNTVLYYRNKVTLIICNDYFFNVPKIVQSFESIIIWDVIVHFLPNTVYNSNVYENCSGYSLFLIYYNGSVTSMAAWTANAPLATCLP